jgi:hypothetical protein
MKNIIEVSRLTKQFKGKTGKKNIPPTEVLDDISFNVPVFVLQYFIAPCKESQAGNTYQQQFYF